jgi:DNA-binding MurR/RpiR family transcriptional regulator
MLRIIKYRHGKTWNLMLLMSLDTVIGIAASGSTPYVLGGLECCRENKISTGCITCNPQSPITLLADFPIVCVVGPEFFDWQYQDEVRDSSKINTKYDLHKYYD